jgi:hypothetical protein
MACVVNNTGLGILGVRDFDRVGNNNAFGILGVRVITRSLTHSGGVGRRLRWGTTRVSGRRRSLTLSRWCSYGGDRGVLALDAELVRILLEAAFA